VIRIFKDRGIRIWGARTLATKSDPQWKYVNVRRLFIMIEQSILQGMQWAVFEPNDKFLWAKLTRDVRAYLMRVWRSGALFGNTPEEAFYVKCDDRDQPAVPDRRRPGQRAGRHLPGEARGIRHLLHRPVGRRRS
jgi:phage tail sheath protein FI